MNLTNDRYIISIKMRSGLVERYFRDRSGWVKVSTRGRRFRATAEQVLNHLLPALAGIKPGLTVKVKHRDYKMGGSKKAHLAASLATRSRHKRRG